MDLTEYQKQRIKDIAAKYQLKLILLFGSRSGDNANSESDFDIAYLGAVPLDFTSAYRLNYEFTKVFEKDRVDTVDLKKAPPLFRDGAFN